MNTPNPIQIFRAGKHTAMSGAALSFSEADLDASAKAYDPAKHEAPLVVGHPKHDAPAYGWVKSLAYADGLQAQPNQVDPAFAEMVANGRFKKISASFYAPDSPQNPVPGVYYLRHVGFLGAQPPAVKGLRSPEFADGEQGVVEFADYGDMQNASLWRRMRDFMISQFGLDKADSIIPDDAVAALEEDARQDTPDEAATPVSAFTESQISATSTAKGDDMSAEEKARLAELEAENTRLKGESKDFAEREAAAVRATRHTTHVAFCEGMVKAGKLLPASQPFIVAFMDHVSADTGVIEFGEGDAKKTQTGIEGFQAFLSAQPKLVEFREVAGGKVAEDEEDATAIAASAIEFQEAEAKAGRTVNIAQAVAHVQFGK